MESRTIFFFLIGDRELLALHLQPCPLQNSMIVYPSAYVVSPFGYLIENQT